MLKRPSLLAFPIFPVGGLLVGGAARDWLRGVWPKDFDWAVPNPMQAAQALAQQTGGSAFALDTERGYWRVHAPAGIQHDLVPLPADINQDLLRRDFTVNAIALNNKHQAIDPTSGQADLKSKRLRMVSEENLRADPLRAWRGLRFETTLGFKIEPHTAATIKKIAADLKSGALPMPAPERIRDEFQALLRHENAAQGILKLDKYGLLALTVPELLAGQYVEQQQDGFHHLNVFLHGVEALNQLIARQPQASLPLRWATLLHDVGKPASRAINPKTGQTTFYGHEKIGAALSQQILERLKLSGDEVKYVSALVKAHMLPLPLNEREAKRFVHQHSGHQHSGHKHSGYKHSGYKHRDLLPDLLSVMLADHEASSDPSSPQSRHAYMVACSLVRSALEEQPAAPLLSGNEVMALLGLDPSPKVGQIMRALAEATALGDLSSKEEAEAFIRQQST